MSLETELEGARREHEDAARRLVRLKDRLQANKTKHGILSEETLKEDSEPEKVRTYTRALMADMIDTLPLDGRRLEPLPSVEVDPDMRMGCFRLSLYLSVRIDSEFDPGGFLVREIVELPWDDDLEIKLLRAKHAVNILRAQSMKWLLPRG